MPNGSKFQKMTKKIIIYKSVVDNSLKVFFQEGLVLLETGSSNEGLIFVENELSIIDIQYRRITILFSIWRSSALSFSPHSFQIL